MLTLRKVYRFRLEPTRVQAEGLARHAGAKRFIFNWALARRKEHYAEHGTSLSLKQLSSDLTALKHHPDTNWLKDADSQLLQQALKDNDRAFKNFFAKRAKYPRFKSKKTEIPSFRIPQRVKIDGNRVYVPKIGLVKLRLSQPVDVPTKSATFKREADGHWYVTLTAEFQMPDVPLPSVRENQVVGMDLGLKDFLVFNNGERVEAPKFFRQSQRKLRRANKQLARRLKGSKRREKARRHLARVHRKARDQRKDFLHKLTTNLVRAYPALSIEDLSVKGMARTRLAKSVLDAAFGEFRRQLTYKCSWNRRHLVVINRWFPSSKLCGACGDISDALTLSDREWTCACGMVHDRDLNAARNIAIEGFAVLVAAGQAETVNARGDCVRLAYASSDR